eukprot:819790_1
MAMNASHTTGQIRQNELNVDPDEIDSILDELEENEKKQRNLNQNQNENENDIEWQDNILNAIRSTDANFIKNLSKSPEEGRNKFEYMSKKQIDSIKVNDKIDHRNDQGKFTGAIVLNKEGTTLTLQYDDMNGAIVTEHAQNVYKFGRYHTISKRKAHRHTNLIELDYIDINTSYNHGGWRYGEINELDDISGQVQVGYLDDDDEYQELWTHLDNEDEVAAVGTKCDVLQMIRQHIYDPFFNIKQHKRGMRLKLKECMKYIVHDILPERAKEGRASTNTYLNQVYEELYLQSICIEMKDRLTEDEDNLSDIRTTFLSDLKPIMEQFVIDFDAEHLCITAADTVISNVHTHDSQRLRKLRKIKVTWSILTKDTVQCESNGSCDVDACMAIKRVNYILELFDIYFISHDEKMEFMTIYNQCVKRYYPQCQIQNDFHHLQAKHMQDILHSKEVIDTCNCNVENAQNEPCEIDMMRCIQRIHMCLKHKEVTHVPQVCNPKHVHDKRTRSRGRTNDESCRPVHVDEPMGKFVTEVKVDASNKMHSFQFGERFFYARYFKQFPNRYVESPKYRNLKEELLSNSIYAVPLSSFAEHLVKAINMSLCIIAKKLKSTHCGANSQFEVPPELPISISHLFCVILYTDHTALQYNYKKYGCRRNDRTQTLVELKQLNSEIGWWYKIFVEAVLFYGTDVDPEKDTFYHGLSAQLLFTSFSPAFKCPISTTVDPNIAAKFAGNGIILKLKPIDSSHDRYFNVEWLSQYPREKERLFCFAHSLCIDDIRFTESSLRCFNDQNHLPIAGMRLFDGIFNKRCAYHHSLLMRNVQLYLLHYLRNFEPTMDVIKAFNEENGLMKLNELFNNEEYDSESILFELQKNGANIKDYLEGNKNEWNVFEEFATTYFKKTSRNAPIPVYLQELFGYMVQKTVAHDGVFIIQSEFEKLKKNLQTMLNRFITKHDVNVNFIQEFEWKIEGELFDKFMHLSRNWTELEGNAFHLVNSDGVEMTIVPYILREDPVSPSHCGVGIVVQSVTEDAMSLYWSFAAKEIKYVCDADIYVPNVTGGTYDGMRAFKNDCLNDLDCLTLTLYVRYA